MDNSNSKFGKPNYDGNRSPNKPLQLRKKSDLLNNDRKSYGSNSYDDNRKPSYGDNGNRSTNQPTRFNPNSGNSFHSDNNERYGNNNRYENNERYGNEKREYNSGERRNNYGNNRYGNNERYGNEKREYNGGEGRNNFGNNRYENNERYGNEKREYNSGEGRNNFGNNRYENNERYGNEKREYNSGERRNNYGNDNRYGNNREGGNRLNFNPNPNRFEKPRGSYQQDNSRHSDGNKKIVFRQRKNTAEGKERKSFSPYRQEVDLSKPVRLNKYLANAGICSRREADEYIQAGVISVNGEIITELGTKILPTDKVMFHEQLVRTERRIYLILNKLKDYVTTVEDTHERKTVMDLVKNACSERIYPVGRLDRNTTGVLLFTNDGDLAARLTHPKYEKKKIYDVVLDKELTDEDFNKILNEGIELEDGVIKADDLAFIKEDNRTKVGIEIHSGKNRIVRRIFDKLGYKVKYLDRVYFAGLTKKNLPRGKYRFLTGKEISTLKMGAYE